MPVLLLFGVILLYGANCAAQGESRQVLPEELAEAERLFVAKVQPLLVRKCGGCHGEMAKEIKGKFDMRTREGLLRGDESGNPSLVPGDPLASPLLQAILWNELEMPPKENDRLNEEEIELVRRWIAAGAPWPDTERLKQLSREAREGKWNDGDDAGVRVATSGGLSADWTDRRYQEEDLWSFRPLAQPEVPWTHVAESRHPVDAFVNRRLESAGIQAAPSADRRTLARRASLDLVGLPPSIEEMEAFVADESPQAFDRYVERLLDRPQYGEQWGRHWLDVVRYADTSGFANDHARPNAWRYRDYVIRSFNNDKPYDQFVREQLAGDEMDASDPEMLVAVGFLRTGPWEHTGMSVAAVTRQQFLDDVTNHVGVSLLGHELRCAKCHDHKFDPFPTRDYYRMMAIFAPVQLADRPAEYLAVESQRGFATGEKRIRTLIEAGSVRSIATLPPGGRPALEVDDDTETKGHAKVNQKRGAYLQRELKRFQPWAMSVYNGPERVYDSNKVFNPLPNRKAGQGRGAETFILTGGSIETPSVQVAPGVLSAVAWDELPDISDATEGRRLALARWITDPRNPLTARVIANRVWQYHFGRGLAGNPNNFGKTGKKPTHPELLDYLASYLIEQNWSLKSLHRLIMSSDVYQRAGGARDESAQRADPGNDLLAVFPPRRLSAEELRDAMLLATGELNLELGGIPARPEINQEAAMQPRHVMGSVTPAYQPDRTPQQRNRRTIYAERIRTLRDPLLEVFNQPGSDVSCELRDASSVTPQVFSLFNGQNSYDRSVALALRLESEHREIEAQVRRAFQLVLGRPPNGEELAKGREHVAVLSEQHRQHPIPPIAAPKYVIREMVEEMTGLNFYWVEDLDVYTDYVADVKPWDVKPETRALADLCLVLFNSNEFIYVY